MSGLNEKINWIPIFTINKFKDPDGKIAQFFKNGGKTEDIKNKENYIDCKIIKGNKLLNNGINLLLNIIAGNSSNYFDNAESRIGVGNDNTTENETQTDLLGTSTNYQEMDATYPIVSNQTITFRSTFDTGDANFHWKEFVIKHNVTSICINRKVSDEGTKIAGETWILEVSITLG